MTKRQATEHAFDGVAALGEDIAEAVLPNAIALGRDVGNRALFLDHVADAVAVVGTVGVDDAAPGQCVQQMLSGAAVGGLSRRQQEGERSAFAIGESVNLGVATAPADADCLCVRAPFPPAAERCAFTCVLSISTSVGEPPLAISANLRTLMIEIHASKTCHSFSSQRAAVFVKSGLSLVEGNVVQSAVAKCANWSS